MKRGGGGWSLNWGVFTPLRGRGGVKISLGLVASRLNVKIERCDGGRTGKKAYMVVLLYGKLCCVLCMKKKDCV